MELTWKHWLRAGAITAVLLVHGLYALPRPHRIREADLQDIEVRGEIEAWADLLGTDVDTLGPLLVDFTGRANEVYSAVKGPFRPPLRFFGVGQAWAMFATPDSWPHRLEIDLRVDGRWEPLYRRWDAHPWRNGAIRYRRVRGIYDAAGDKNQGAYWNFTRWAAREALLERPDADAVRVRQVRTHTTLPGRPEDGKESVRLERVHRRAVILPADGLVP